MIGLSGINLYARSASTVFATQDRDLFLPPDPDNALAAWRVCERRALGLSCGPEPLDLPRDRLVVERVIENRALVRATDGAELHVDLTLVMAGFDFETVWSERRIFRVDDVEIPVARLAHIVESKRRTGRDKDRLFFATHADAIRDLMEAEPAGKPRRTRSTARHGAPQRTRRKR
ncbi:MAG: hypothetical protein ACREQY_08740 [Candidatus Binatia bacterium]